MIQVTLFENGWEVEGHAEYDVRGKDIVCSAVSVLSQVLAESMDKYTNTKILITPGYMEVRVLLKHYASQVLYEAFIHGVTEIARAYPDNVKIIRE